MATNPRGSKPSKKEQTDYLKRKYMNNCSELKPKNIEFELISGTEFAYIKTIGGKKGITIKNK